MTLTTLSISTLFTFALVPLIAIVSLGLAAIPCILSPGARPAAAVKALYCYGMQSVGAALMTAGALPAVYGVLEKFSMGTDRFSAEMYLALLLLFSTGGLTFLWHEQMAEKIDDASRKVPAVLFWYAFKMIGSVLILFGLLTFLFTMLLTRPLVGAWWITPTVILFYGVLLSWCTRSPSGSAQAFKLLPLHNGMKTASAVKGKRK